MNIISLPKASAYAIATYFSIILYVNSHSCPSKVIPGILATKHIVTLSYCPKSNQSEHIKLNSVQIISICIKSFRHIRIIKNIGGQFLKPFPFALQMAGRDSLRCSFWTGMF